MSLAWLKCAFLFFCNPGHLRIHTYPSNHHLLLPLVIWKTSAAAFGDLEDKCLGRCMLVEDTALSRGGLANAVSRPLACTNHLRLARACTTNSTTKAEDTMCFLSSKPWEACLPNDSMVFPSPFQRKERHVQEEDKKSAM